MLFFCANQFSIRPTDLHILHISTAKTWRGGERQVSFLMTELRKKGVRQTMLCARGGFLEKWCREAGFACFTFRKWFSPDPLVGWRVRQLENRLGCTHIHTHDSHGHGHAVLAAAMFGTKAPLIVHRRVDFPVGGNWFSRWKYNHPAVSAIICTSFFIENMMRPALKSRALLTTIHSGIDLSVGPTGQGNDLRREFQVPEGHFLIINLAAVAPHKDYPTFIRTASILLENGLPAVFLAVGGDGGEMQRIQHLISENNLAGKVILTGHRTDVPDILSQTDLLLFTSKTEGLGGATLDALHAGVPVVTTAVGGVVEIIESGVTGLTAPVGDAPGLARLVKKVLSDSGLCAKLIANGKAKAALFSKEINAEKVLEVYQKCSQWKS